MKNRLIPRKRTILLIAGYFILPFIFAVLTSIKVLENILLLLPLVLFAVLMVTWFLPRKNIKLSVLLWVLLALSLVGSTGWFFSPFFFTLYLIAIALGFIYRTSVSISFTLALVILFSFSLTGERANYDFLILLSLLSVIPITVALRRSFLLVQQEKKGILILESDKRGSNVTSLEEILNNKVNTIGVLLRQPITYLKQGLTLLNSGKLSKSEAEEILPRMEKSADELFTLVKEFETNFTKNSFLKRNNSSKKSIKLPS